MFDFDYTIWYYMQAVREGNPQAIKQKKILKFFQKSFKNDEKMLDFKDKLVVIYTSCPRESG